jgi:branched-chain amino acid transport system substrate-binding protein
MIQRRNEFKLLILSVFLVIIVAYALYQLIVASFLVDICNLLHLSNCQSTQEQSISLGEKLLITADTNPDKEAGIRAFAQSDFKNATKKFQASLRRNKNDPETVLYLNNALARHHKNVLKIAVSVPIGGNLNVAKEILRGVAQAQDEINHSGGINGKLLLVEIANDNNDPDTAKRLALAFVSDETVLAVVGHNSSDASIAAAPVYQQGRLVMISPTSTADRLSGIGNYVLRAVPSDSFDAFALSLYATKKAHLTKIAICVDSTDRASQSLSGDFAKYLQTDGAKIADVSCDFSSLKFDPTNVVAAAVSNGADGLLLTPSVDKLEKAIDIARNNKDRLSLLSYSVMYTLQTLYSGQVAVNGMVLTVPWYSRQDQPFVKKAKSLWGGSVNWRTAMAYDATHVLITGLQQSNTRDGLQQILHNPNFSVQSGTGAKIKFSPSGDRIGGVTLVKIQPGQNSGTGYDFVPVGIESASTH